MALKCFTGAQVPYCPSWGCISINAFLKCSCISCRAASQAGFCCHRAFDNCLPLLGSGSHDTCIGRFPCPRILCCWHPLSDKAQMSLHQKSARQVAKNPKLVPLDHHLIAPTRSLHATGRSAIACMHLCSAIERLEASAGLTIPDCWCLSWEHGVVAVAARALACGMALP